MPAPSVATYSVAALVDAHTAFLALLDAGSAGLCRIRSSADVLLAEITLDIARTYPVAAQPAQLQGDFLADVERETRG